MKAIVEIGGKQLKVEKGQTFIVNRLEKEPGKKMSFGNVLLIEDKGKTSIGNPSLENASVSASIIDHLKGDKVIVFKKKRRKGYKVKNGHRQSLTQISIQSILHNVSTSKDVDNKKITKKSVKKESETKNDNLVGKRISKTKSKTKV